MMSYFFTQASYAANLQNQGRGLAVYRPFSIEPHSNRVGDVAFFDSEGIYRWLQNAFHSDVSLDSNVNNF